MGKKSRSNKKAEEVMVLCPECGGKEFASCFTGRMVSTNVRRVKVSSEETLIDHDVLAVESIDAFACSILTCTTCNAKFYL